VGETTELTATATYSDGTTRNVNSESMWTSTTPRLFSVSAGRVTVVDYGVGDITARLGNRTSGLQITATPLNTFVFWGRARVAGMSGLSSVRVVETASNRSTVTDTNGNFQIAALASAQRFKFDRDGYENTEVTPQMTAGPNIWVESAMQTVVRLVPGQAAISLSVAPHDVSYVIGSDPCYPCKLVRVTTSTAGTLRVTLTGQNSTALRVWINGQQLTPAGSPLTTEAQVTAGEIPLYVGWNLPLDSGGANNYVNFTLAASMAGS
jgi:hypothetical protein